MSPLPLELDHVGIAVGTLEDARRDFERLGFRLTPRSLHRGARKPGGAVEPWGSGNHCAMFEHGYLELIGVWNPDLWSPTDEMLDRYRGLHIVALREDDAEAAYATLSARGGTVDPPRLLTREIEVDNSTRTLAFRNIGAHRDRFPEARLLFIEHRTPELLWRDELLAQPNGVVALEEAYLCAADLDAAVDRYTTLLARAPDDAGPGAAAVFIAHVVRVAVDRETGRVRPTDYLSVQDVGFAMNPLLVEGQLHGGAAQGLGIGLHEALRHDDAGQLLTGTLMDYGMPRATSVPPITTHLLQRPSHGPYGALGVGEPPIVAGAAAAANAVTAATGAQPASLPLDPESVWAETVRRAAGPPGSTRSTG